MAKQMALTRHAPYWAHTVVRLTGLVLGPVVPIGCNFVFLLGGIFGAPVKF